MIACAGDSSDDDAIPLDMDEGDVSGEDEDDDEEAEPLGADDDSADEAVAPAASGAAVSAAAASPAVSPVTMSPLRDRRTSNGSNGPGSGVRRGSVASGSSRASSPAIGLGDDDELEALDGAEGDVDDAEAAGDSVGETHQQQQQPQPQQQQQQEKQKQTNHEQASGASEETLQFLGITRRSLFDQQTQTRLGCRA